MAGTSLAEQLKKLAAPQTSILVHSKKRASLLFDAKDAASYDRATIYKIGLSGFEKLKSLEPKVAEFEKTLFNETSLNMERAIEDQQTNAKLDQLIHKFLILLSPYVNLSCTHKALEWLICRFHIHQFNVDSIMALFLPYHDTNIFGRMVQVLSLQEKGGRWMWLQKLKKEGIPMSKLFLLSRASSDTSFFKFVCNLPLQGVQVYNEKSYCLTTLFAFYCTTVIGALEQSGQVSEVQVTHLLPSLMAGISSSHVDFTASAFMILGHLVTKIRLTPLVFGELFHKVCKSEQSSLRSEATLVLVVMAQCNRTPSVLASVSHLATAAWFLPSLSQLSSSGIVVYPLVAALVTDCLTALKTLDNINQPVLQQFLIKLIEELHFNKDEAKKLLKIFAEIPLKSENWYHDILCHIERAYPDAFDEAVKTNSSLLGLLPDYTARNDLIQRLTQPSEEARLKAIRHIRKKEELLQEEWVQEILLNFLSIDCANTITAVIGLASHLPQHRVTDQLIRLTARCWHTPRLYSLAPDILNALQDQNNVDPLIVLILTLPFLLPSKENQINTAEAVLKSSAVKNNEFMQQPMKPFRKKYRDMYKVEEFPGEVLNIIRTGLKDIDVNSVLRVGQQLQPHGTVYQLMTLLVAAGALRGEMSSAKLKPLLECLTQYNNSPAISSECEVPEELNEDNIVAVVASCQSGKLPFQGSLFVLSEIMKKMKSPFPDNKYICDVREPTVALFTIVFCMVIQLKKSLRHRSFSQAYSTFYYEMFQKCCATRESQIDLLSNMVLGCPDIVGDSIEYIQNLINHVRSVSESVLVPALLVALHSEDYQARQNTVKLLHTFPEKLALPNYHKLLDQLQQYSEEMSIDHEQVNVALYMCLSPDPSVQSLLNKPLRQEMANILNCLMDIIVAPDTPAYMSAKLLDVLDQINSEALLERLLPLGLNILLSEQRSSDDINILQAVIRRINASTASAFQRNYLWSFVKACLKDQNAQKLDVSTPAVLMLQQIDRELFAALSFENQERLLSLVVSCVAETENGDVASTAASAFKRIVLDAKSVANLLEPMRDANIELPDEGKKKRGWTVKTAPPLELLSSVPWKCGLCLLEFIQNKKKIDNVQVLLPRLFEILSRCLEFEEQAPVEYTKQVLLTNILHCCQKLSPDGNPVDLPEASLQVELVVECVRGSSNPQTHHHALLLLAHVASMIPDRVLHSVMPIFTFVGSSVLRQDDTYSFQIISKIVETIVPILVKKDTEVPQLTSEVVQVLRVFAGALLDIPEHRRTPLYTKLLTTLHRGQFLWAFLSLVFESHVLHPTPDTSTVKEQGSVPKKLEVGLQLCHQFPPASVLATSCKLIQYLCNFPVNKDDKKLESFKKSCYRFLFDVDRATEKQLRHYTYTALTFLSFLLSSKQFLRIMATLMPEEIQSMKEMFQQMFEGILTFTQTVSKQVDLTVGQVTSKYWKSMFNICFDVLAKTNALLPGDMFLEVITTLLAHPLFTLRCKSLELLNWRLQQAPSRPMDPEQLLGLLPPLLSLVKGKGQKEEQQTQSQLVQQTALLSIKFLARQLAADHPAEFQKVFNEAVKILNKRTIQDPVLASAVLCIGELCHALGAHAIVSLPNFMPSVIAILQNDALLSCGDLLLLSIVSALHKIVDSLAMFLSPYLDQLIQHLCVFSVNCANLSDNQKLQPVFQRMKSIRQKISADIPLRVLLPAVTESYSQLVSTNRTSAIPPLMSLLGESFKSGHQLTPELTSFFLTALDFRSQALSHADVQVVEPAVISAVVALVFKLSESSFRPFFYKIFNWAVQSEANKDRFITFYKLTCTIADSLKGLFVSFAHYFLKNAATLLDENNKAKHEDIGWSEEKAMELVEAILRVLQTIFIHDASHFVNKERFDSIMQPIVDQLENELGGEGQLEQRTTELVIPCLTQMAVSAADDTLWKQLNYQILLKTRHSHSQVRIGGVLAVCEIAKKLGEEFLPLLPETVPFLAELLEDEDENVEKTSKRVVQELESALGEPISKYF